MARYVLRPCKLRVDRIVPVSTEDVVLDWSKFVERFAPNRTLPELMRLRTVRIGSFMGLMKGGVTGKIVPFFIWNNDRTNKISWILRRDPSVSDRFVEIFQLMESRPDTKVIEPENQLPPEPQPPRTMAEFQARENRRRA